MIGSSKLVTVAESNIGLSYQVALPFDFTLQSPSSPLAATATTFITPATVARTLAEICQVDWGSFQSVSKTTLYLAKLLKS